MRYLAIAAAALLTAHPGLAQTVPGGPQKANGLAGALYRYEPREGQERAHAEAYRRHLAWHKAQGDPLDWYAWRVETGPRAGDFVDGTFGVPWSAFDARVKPAEDGADFAATAGPLARPVDRFYVELLPECSRLQNGPPASHLRVYTVEAFPGQGSSLEAFLRAAREPLPGAWGWYRVIGAGASPSYLLMVPHSGLAELPAGERLWRGLSEAGGSDLKAWIREIRGEDWSFLPEESLLQPAPPPR